MDLLEYMSFLKIKITQDLDSAVATDDRLWGCRCDMKKRICCMLITILILLSGCSSSKGHLQGIELFAMDYPSEYELNVCIIPSEDFLSEYEYIDADYSFTYVYDGLIFWHDVETSVLSIKYSPSVYGQAKDFCLEEMMLTSAPIVEYNGFVFYDNFELAAAQNRTVHIFPGWFNLFAYNDNTKELPFLGYYDSDLMAEDAKDVLNNWDEFFEKNFNV